MSIPRTTLAIVAVTLSSPSVSSAETEVQSDTRRTDMEDYVFGVGAMLGDPTALGLALRLNETHALQLHFGWQLDRETGTRAFAMLDYLAHLPVEAERTQQAGLLSLYVGVGGKVGVDTQRDSGTIGARVPLGISFLFARAPVELFFEVAPGIEIAPNVDSAFDGAAGVRVFLF